MHGLENDILKG